MPATINVCLVGQKFMGRTHSNAFLKVGKFFDLPVLPVMHTIVRPQRGGARRSSRTRWGWQNASTDWKKAVTNPEIDLVDVGTPNNVHAEMAIAALEAGKHVACEKPLAGTLADARQMRDAAKQGEEEQDVRLVQLSPRAGRRAGASARQGGQARAHLSTSARSTCRTGAGPGVPLLWRFQKKFAGSGAHGDLNAHIIDMARFITGDEITEVIGSIAETFIKERDIPQQGPKGGIAGGTQRRRGKKGKSDVDDAVLFLARFKQGAVASFEATRLATGNQNKNGLEINGEKGSIRFNFEDMNYLEFYDATARAQDCRAGPRSWSPTAATTPTPATGGPTRTSSATSTASSTRPPT